MSVKELALPANGAVSQADGDPGYSPVVYVDRRGNDRAVDRFDGQTNAEFSEEHGLHVCEDCKKYCEPVLTEHVREPFASATERHFCYVCDFDGRVKFLVELGVADLDTAGKIVHRLIAYEHPGLGVEKVVIIR